MFLYLMNYEGTFVNCKGWQLGHTSSQNYLYIAAVRSTLSGILNLKKLVLKKFSKPLQNRQFIKFARIPVEFVVRFIRYDCSKSSESNYDNFP